MSSQNKRVDMDVTKLMMSDFKVELLNDNMQELYVYLDGPKDSPYEGGRWKIRVTLLDDYPYKSPSIGFVTKVFHPNVHETSGSVCLDVLNERWSPMFDLTNVFEAFLPQLLLYPNPLDPVNVVAAQLMKEDRNTYDAKVKEYVERYAKPVDADAVAGEKSSDEEVTEDDKDDDEPASKDDIKAEDESASGQATSPA